MITRIIFMVVLLFGASEIINSQELKSGDIRRSSSNCATFDMIYLEGGKFNVANQENKETNIDDFFIGKYEVTQELWEEVMGANPSNNKGDLLPMDLVSFNDIVGENGFIEKLNALGIAPAGYKFALPTIAQWEYAARGGKMGDDASFIYSGSDDVNEVAWYADNSDGKSHVVGGKESNVLGIYDMSGNVCEWVKGEDAFCSRGGSWNKNADQCRVDNCIETESADTKSNDLGFRVALVSVPPMEITINGAIFKMIYVSKGSFVMGSNENIPSIPYPGQSPKPAHKVTLTKNYYIGETELTYELFHAVMGTTNPLGESTNKLPINGSDVSFSKVVEEFIPALNAATGMTFRLPTEAEWEFAANGGDKSKGYKYSGSNDPDEVAWHVLNSGNSDVHPVATKLPNELGIYDMSGNLSEWVSDFYATYSPDDQIDPVGPETGTDGIFRGGDIGSRIAPTAIRYKYPKGSSIWRFGYRLVLESSF